MSARRIRVLIAIVVVLMGLGGVLLYATGRGALLGTLVAVIAGVGLVLVIVTGVVQGNWQFLEWLNPLECCSFFGVFEAQHMLVLLGSLAHNVVVWARRWLNSPQIARFGILRMVRDVFHISGMLRFDSLSQVVEIVLNQDAHLAHLLIRSLRELLTPLN